MMQQDANVGYYMKQYHVGCAPASPDAWPLNQRVVHDVAVPARASGWNLDCDS